MSVSFTCNSCVTQFKTSDLQRYHMKTDWHRYNLKRRVAELAPVSAGEFAEKLQISEREQAANQVDEFGFPILKSNNRNKHYKKRTDTSDIHDLAVQNEDPDYVSETTALHKTISGTESVTSQISKMSFETENNTDYGEDSVSEYGFTSESNYDAATSDDELSDKMVNNNAKSDNLSNTKCIYCGLENNDIERNVKHMFHKHGLYIPERSYLINLEGLLTFLNRLILEEYSCLCCNFEGSSLESIRAHMNSKRHARMPYETKEEKEVFAEFYDFSSLFEKDEPKKKTMKSDKKIQFTEPENDGEDKVEYNINSNYTTVSVDESGLELTLPSGARLGHRAGQRYYRQNLPVQNENSGERRAVTSADRRLISGVTEKQYKKGMKKMQQLEKRATDDRFRKEVKRANFQTHYRDELLQ